MSILVPGKFFREDNLDYTHPRQVMIDVNIFINQHGLWCSGQLNFVKFSKTILSQTIIVIYVARGAQVSYP
ncbi:hypothetical protein CENA302_07360 [Cylindrospermopsis raciborskii CENA302]|uniref:Uncharacterized protein n=1 Tax=Cylindrospermopsis raciborskii CENA302 TaxID=1170768 RepID=A0A9Q5QXG9_9CYAN|nr:hypothetical protein CENA302_07360 [Cylindrospermopsis raciborskii CENA302]